MKQLTVRGFDPQLESALRELSEREGISLSQAAVKLMQAGAKLKDSRRRRVIGDSLDRFIGTLTEEEEREFLAATESCAQVDPSFWE
ncbi:MAG: hypothetical protein HY815_09425 [Candidatus Riflebacteria bacterium]|nr:hypothetical protein [Candidatus Riflebacteria bacterium]